MSMFNVHTCMEYNSNKSIVNEIIFIFWLYQIHMTNDHFHHIARIAIDLKKRKKEKNLIYHVNW